MFVEYQIYLDEDQIKRKNANKNINYVNLELNFIQTEIDSDDENNDDESLKKEDKNVFESTIILKMYNHKIEKYQNSDKLIKKDFAEFLENMKNGKKCDLDEEYIIHKYHYISYLRYHKNKLIYLLSSPVHEFQTILHIKHLKNQIIKVFQEFVDSSDNFFN
jgi:hypothetical protein